MPYSLDTDAKIAHTSFLTFLASTWNLYPTPSATNVSSLSYSNYTSVKYYVEVENVTNNEYSTFHVAANAYEGDSNYVKYGNVSTALTAKRDIQNTDVAVTGFNVILQFTPMENRDYIVRVSEIRIDKPDDVNNDITINY